MTIPKLLLVIQAGIFGLLIGSFLNVCISRLPQKISLLGRSFCPHCHATIPLYRNIPLISFLLQSGQSACCRKPISIQYPLIEALTGLISIITLLHSNSIIQYFIWFLLFMSPLIVISIIDLKLKIIPDVISIPFILVGVLVSVYEKYPNWLTALKFSSLGILVGSGTLVLLGIIISRLKKMESLGGGDVKLAAMLGAFLGWKALVFVFFVSSVFGLVYAIFNMIFNKAKDKLIPFGPFLSLGAMIFWLYGHQLTNLYYIEILGMQTNPFFP